MNRQEEEFDEAMRAWYLKNDKKRKVKNGIKITFAIILLAIIWGYSGYLMLRTSVMYATTEWYEVEAYCESSVAYEKKYVSTERVNGKRKSVHKTETRYSNTYVYTAKDGKEYTAIKEGTTDSREGTTATYFVDEKDPTHAVPKEGDKLVYAVILIIAGGMTLCIWIGLRLSLQKPPKELTKKGKNRKITNL